MPKSRIKRLLSPLLDSHPELVFAGDRLILKPVRHVIRSIHIQGFPKHRTFHAIWNAQILCWPEEFYELGGVVDIPRGWPMGGVRDPFFGLPEDEQSTSLCQEIAESTLPVLRTLEGSDEVCRRFLEKDGPNTHNTQYRFWFELLLGRFDAGRALLNKERAAWIDDGADYWSQTDPVYYEKLAIVCRLLDRNLDAEIVQYLHASEAVEAKRFKVQRIWEPTPFPFEAA